MLEVKNLQVTINTVKGPFKVVDGLSFKLAKGETLGIVGESGSGKTMAVLSILGLNRLTKEFKGEILYKGSALSNEKDFAGLRGSKIALLPQDPASCLNPSMTIGGQLKECLDNKAEAIGLLDKVGIAGRERLKSYPHQLSGGMKQRAALAMAIARAPEILIADELTSGLDVTVQAQILKLLNDLKKEQALSMILVTHDMGIVAAMCDKVLVMYGGRPAEYGPVDSVFYHSIHPYTKGLINSISRLDRERRNRFRPLEGRPLSIEDTYNRCPFLRRCSKADKVCSENKPKTIKAADGHVAFCHMEA